VLAGLSLLLGGCSAAPQRADESPPATTSGPVLVTSDVRYAAGPLGWRDPTLDLYVPADAGEPPVAVIVPDGAADPGAPDYVALARALAARGVAAALVTWGVASPALTTLAGRPLPDVVAQTEQTTAEVACALAFVAQQAGPGVGTPARPLIVVGHGSGANAAAMAVLTSPARFDPCFSADAPPPVAAAVLWDGDWLGAVAGDVLGDGAAEFLRAYSPWPDVDSTRTSTYVEVGVNANRLVGLAVPAEPTSGYLTTRDPEGTMTADLRSVDAFADGAVDPVDVTRAFSVGLGDARVVSQEREVHGEGDPGTLGPRVRALVVDSVVQLTRP
jgi:hypothetical protein